MKLKVSRPNTKKKITSSNWLAFSYLLLLLVFALFAERLPLGFSPTDSDLEHVYQEPFQWYLYQTGQAFHWLGTDDIGHDLLANLVYGARTAFLVSVPAIVLATLVGVGLGLIAGYFGDTGFSLPVGKLMAFIIAGLFFFFYAFVVDLAFIYPDSNLNPTLLIAGVGIISYLLFLLFSSFLTVGALLKKSIKLPIDLIVLKTIELVGAVPRLLLILCLAAFLRPSLGIVIILSTLTYWPAMARLTRAEILKIKQLPYIEAAVALGYRPGRVILRHALPNMAVPLLVAITFGICNLIALEATLSFLGVGIPVDMPSWGRTINKIRENFTAWWLVLFPGLTLLATVLSLQNVNNLIIEFINPQKS